MTLRKIPRGIIIHSLQESLIFLFKSMFFRLDDKTKIESFEISFASHSNKKYCTSFGLARTAIFFILKSLNLQKGSKILMPPITIKGILDVVVSLGLEPVYVDLDPDTLCIDLNKLNSSNDKKIKAAIITPLYGLIPNLGEIASTLSSRGIFSILDFSHSLNAEYEGKKITTFFDASVYSSSSIKILDTLGGGHVLTNDKTLFSKLITDQKSLRNASRYELFKTAFVNLCRNLATTVLIFDLITYPAIKLLSVFDRKLVLKQTGGRDKKPIKRLPLSWFSEFSSVQADIGLNLLNKTKKIDVLRKNNALKIRSAIGENHFPHTTLKSDNVFWQLMILIKDSKRFQKFCLSHTLDTTTSSLELISSLRNYPGRVHLKNASYVYHNGYIIPCNHLLKIKDIDRISTIIKKYFETSISLGN